MRTRTIFASGGQLERVQHRFELWRRTRKRCSPIPEILWGSAVELAREHGLHRTARALRLNYYSLKNDSSRLRARRADRRTKPRRGTASAGGQRPFLLHHRDGKCAGPEDEDPS